MRDTIYTSSFSYKNGTQYALIPSFPRRATKGGKIWSTQSWRAGSLLTRTPMFWTGSIRNWY